MAQQERDKMLTLMLAALLALPQGANEGVIAVTVRDPETRQGIPAVRVTVTLNPTQVGQPRSLVVSSNTDDKGFAEFKNLLFGVYTVSAEREGYAQMAGLGQNLYVRDDAPRAATELNLVRAMTLTGRVLGPDGTPMSNVHVSSLALRYNEGRRVLSHVSPRPLSAAGSRAAAYTETYTDERGEYRIEGLPPAEYYLRVGNAGQRTAPNKVDARITYYPGVVRLSEATPVVLRDQDISGIDIRIPQSPEFKVSGTLVGVPLMRFPDGREGPTSGTFFLASADPGNIDEPQPLYDRTVATAVPGESRFEIRGVVPGPYYLYALVTVYEAVGQSNFLNRIVVQVQDQDVTGLRMVLGPLHTVKGRILVDGDASSISWSGLGVGSSPRELLPAQLSGVAGLLLRGRLGGDGQAANEFTLGGLVEDVRYAPTINGLPPDAYIADIRQGGSSVFNNGGSLRANGAEGPIEITVGLRGGVVQGVVRNASGQGVAPASVALVPSAPRRQTMQLYKEVLTDASGQFNFRGVAPGDYKVFAWPASPRGQGYKNEEFLSRYEFRGAPVTVSAGASATVQVTVTPLQ
jgi:protocatechuate 3,4-dioxygenase beta subunit